MSIKNLFYSSYWFDQPFPASGTVFFVLVGCFLLLLISGIVLRIISQRKKEKVDRLVFKRFSNFSMIMGLWGLVWMFFRQEKIIFLAWRFWMMLWLAVAIWWFARILDYVVRRVPIIKQEKAEKMEREKYLSKTHKHTNTKTHSVEVF